MTEEKIFHQFWPEDVPKTIEIPENLTLHDMLRNTAEKYPDAIAITYYGTQMTYAVPDKCVDILATKFIELGLKKGETVALHFANVPPCVISYYAALRAGGRVTLLSPLFAELEIKYQLNDSETKIFILWEGFCGLDDPVIPNTCVETVIYCNLGPYFSPDPTVKGDPVSEDPNQLYLEDILMNTKPDRTKFENIKIDTKEDLAILQYTGGTAGLPKGAMLTHYSVVANVLQTLLLFSEVEIGKEVICMALPLYHIYAQVIGMNLGVKMAANLVMIGNPREVEEYIEAVEEYKITLFPGVAAIYNNINNHPGVEKHDWSSIKCAMSGAGPLPREVQEKFERLSGCKLREGYGLTEASPLTHANPLLGRQKIGSIGLPVPNTEMKIVSMEDPDKILGINEVGELCVKGPQIMKGYYKRPERNAIILAGGWLHTGDGALIDEEGYTVIKSRIKNLIKYKGHSVYPAEVEEFLYEFEPILECGVIGVPDKEAGGENIKAFIVLKDEFKGKVSEQDIIDWAKENMAKYKYPRSIQFLEEIPKTNTGKVLHRLLREGKFET